MTISDLQKRVLALAKEKDWGTKPDDIVFAEKIALIHSEVSETLQAYRKHTMDGHGGVAEELGDVLLRVLHLAGIYGINLEPVLEKKMESNKNRDWSNDQLHLNKKK